MTRKPFLRIFAIAPLLIFFTGCATVQMPISESFVKTPPPKSTPAELAAVYFYRPYAPTGSAVSYHVYDGHDLIGALKADSAFIYEATPGEHRFWAKNETVATVVLYCEPGSSYYIEGGVNVGRMMGNPDLMRMYPDVAQKRMSGIQFYRFDWTAKPKATDP